MSVCILCVCSGHRGQKKALNSLDLELQMVVSGYVVLGIEAGTSRRAPRTLNLSHSFHLGVFDTSW